MLENVDVIVQLEQRGLFIIIILTLQLKDLILNMIIIELMEYL